MKYSGQFGLDTFLRMFFKSPKTFFFATTTPNEVHYFVVDYIKYSAVFVLKLKMFAIVVNARIVRAVVLNLFWFVAPLFGNYILTAHLSVKKIEIGLFIDIFQYILGFDDTHENFRGTLVEKH